MTDNDPTRLTEEEREALDDALAEVLVAHQLGDEPAESVNGLTAAVERIVAACVDAARAEERKRVWAQGYAAGRDDYRGRVDVDRQTPNPYSAALDPAPTQPEEGERG